MPHRKHLLAIGIVAFLTGCANTPPVRGAAPHLAAYFDCVGERGATLSAHRAQSSSDQAENSIGAILATGRAIPGAILEMDVVRTRDGHLILMHDETLDRTTSGMGPVAAHDLSDIQRLRLTATNGLQTSEAPPTLSEALAAVRSVGAIASIDLKASDDAQTLRLAEDVIQTVRTAGAAADVILITYSAAMARAVSQAAPEMMVSAGIDALADLDGLDTRQILAWTGTREPRPDLWQALRARDVEPQFGTLGAPGRRRDDLFAADGDLSEYRDLVRQGVVVIATSTPLAARDALRASLDRAATCPRAPAISNSQATVR